MRFILSALVTAAIGLCLLVIPPLQLLSMRAPVPRQSAAALPVLPRPPRNPSAEALRAACRAWTRAQQTVNLDLDSLEAWDPKATEAAAGVGREDWRRRFMARDPSGNLRPARAAARRAAALARTPREAYAAAGLLSRIAR